MVIKYSSFIISKAHIKVVTWSAETMVHLGTSGVTTHLVAAQVPCLDLVHSSVHHIVLLFWFC